MCDLFSQFKGHRKCRTLNSQIYIQIVFAVQGRQNLISKSHREELQKYINGIVQNRDQKLLSIFCMPVHTHILVGMKPSLSISDLVRDIKAGSSKFINDNNWINGNLIGRPDLEHSLIQRDK